MWSGVDGNVDDEDSLDQARTAVADSYDCDRADRLSFQKLLTIALGIRNVKVNGKLDWDALR